MMTEPRQLVVREKDSLYSVLAQHIPKQLPGVVAKTPFSSVVQYHLNDCVQRANEMECPQQRKHYVARELELMLG